MGSPAVIFQANFEYKWHIGGYDYLEYMNRPEAFDKTKHLRDEYKDFIDYMQNSEKSDGLFDAESDLLNAEQIEAYRCQETISQSEGCPKYYGVISFRNDFLQETGVLAADGRLDIGLLKQLTREGMSELIGTSRKLDAANVYWNAAIHTNTDNIHVHYTLCEYHRKENRKAVYRDGDMLELKAFEALKSKVVNRLLGNDFSKQLTEFERGVLLNGVRMSVPSCKEQLVDLARVLPPEGGWQYNRPKMRKYREQIDRCAMSIIRSSESLSQSYDEYIKKLDSRAVDLRDNIYGSNKTQRYLDFKKNRLDDFKARAGNIILKHIADSELQALLAAGRGSAHPSEGTSNLVGAADGFREQLPPRGIRDAIRRATDPKSADPSEEELPLPEPPENSSWWDASQSYDPSEEELMHYLAEQEQSSKVSSQKRVTVTLFRKYKLAKLYLDPDSGHYDLDVAIKYLEAAAEQEQLRPFANYKLAKIYLEDPENRNEPKAIKLLESIAEQNSSAAYRLGRLYLLGTEQMPADKEKGLAYLQLAASHDHKGAEQLLDRLAHSPQNRPKPRCRHYVQRGNVAANLQTLLRSISSDMEQAHRAAMREFEQQEWLNEQRGRLY